MTTLVHPEIARQVILPRQLRYWQNVNSSCRCPFEYWYLAKFSILSQFVRHDFFEINHFHLIFFSFLKQNSWCKLTGGDHFRSNFGYWTKPIFELGREFDKSNPYMKFGSNLVKKMTKVECPQVQTDRQLRPVCRPSWLSFVERNPYWNLNESLMEPIHIWN